MEVMEFSTKDNMRTAEGIVEDTEATGIDGLKPDKTEVMTQEESVLLTTNSEEGIVSKWASKYKVDTKATAYENWKCINDALVQNQCWICQTVFPRGKKKKVFMISQIIQVFKEIYSNSLEGNEDDRIKLLTAFEDATPNVCKCWQSYLYLEGNEQLLAVALEQANTQVWASGLACCRNDLCTIVFKALFADQGPEERVASLNSLKGTFTRSLNCPPGCDCGWQFIALPSSSNTS